MDTPAKTIIAKFGGLTALARALGHRHPTTVQGWLKSGFVPARQQVLVIEAAKREGIAIEAADFFPAQKAPTAGSEAA